MAVPRAVLIGIHGHGRVHLERLLDRHRRGSLELAGLADPLPPADDLDGVFHHPEAAEVLARVRPDLVVIAAPIHAHAGLAELALDRGAHLLLEKPPVTRVADHHRLVALAADRGRHCQVGFQAFGSSAVRELRELIAGGALGTVERISVVGRWYRAGSYFTRAPWAGRRVLSGRIAADGALTNPFAHGVALALALAGPGPVREVRTEPYRAHPIHTDDTIAARIVTAGGVPVTVAVTLCAAEPDEPYVRVFGSEGSATLWYTLDRLRIGGDERAGDRTELIDDLLDHLADDPARDVLACPLRATLSFTEVLEAVVHGPEPRPIPDRFLAPAPDGRTIPGIERAVAEAGERGLLFSELNLKWAS